MSNVKISISAALVMATAHAVVALHANAGTIDFDSAETHHDMAAEAAVSSAIGREIVLQARPAIISALGIDEDLLAEGHVEVAQLNADSHLIDSTYGGDSRFSCYSNCHSACHGSRGWR
ncbi:MAG: hypothetical protein OXD29_10575 [Roseovarius sp.]|nr:hypothetical protein [Roseovarius sp.]